MANHTRNGKGVDDKRAALTGAQHNAYVHRDQVGGNMRRESDGRWRPLTPEEAEREQARERRRLQDKGPLTLGTFIKRNIGYILSAGAVVLIVMLLIFGVRAFNDIMGPTEPEEYQSPYDWSQLDRTNGRYAYVVNGEVKSRLGVDVAGYQKEIDWDAVAADGIDFAIVRLGYRGATEGELYLDDYYEANLSGAKAAGLDCGVYFFSQAVTADEAREEADFVLANLNGAKLEYPIAFDSEVVAGVDDPRTAGLSDEELSAVADAFCDRIEEAGYTTWVYGNARDLRSYDIDALTGRGIWWAEYDVAQPSHYTDIVMWQYSSSGHVAGIDTAADMNIDLTNALS